VAHATGTLRSLHQFMLRSPGHWAVRLYAGPLEVTSVSLPQGRAFRLLNLPYFLAAKVHEYLDWADRVAS